MENTKNNQFINKIVEYSIKGSFGSLLQKVNIGRDAFLQFGLETIKEIDFNFFDLQNQDINNAGKKLIEEEKLSISHLEQFFTMQEFYGNLDLVENKDKMENLIKLLSKNKYTRPYIFESLIECIQYAEQSINSYNSHNNDTSPEEKENLMKMFIERICEKEIAKSLYNLHGNNVKCCIEVDNKALQNLIKYCDNDFAEVIKNITDSNLPRNIILSPQNKSKKISKIILDK